MEERLDRTACRLIGARDSTMSFSTVKVEGFLISDIRSQDFYYTSSLRLQQNLELHVL